MKEQKKCVKEGCEMLGSSWGKNRGFKKFCAKHLREYKDAKKPTNK